MIPSKKAKKKELKKKEGNFSEKGEKVRKKAGEKLFPVLRKPGPVREKMKPLTKKFDPVRVKARAIFSNTYVKKAGTAALVLIALFLVLMPVLPQIPFYIRQLRGENVYIRHEAGEGGGLISQDRSDEDSIPEVNTLIIPAVGIDVPIVEGQTDEALDRGAWRRPATGTPVQGGNTVITGHRFRYLPPSNLTFYHLDKVQVGDAVIIYWDRERYEYEVDDVFVVGPEQVEIESNTAEPRLTLYTCTPLWTAKQRLVVVALPLEAASADETGEVPLEEL
jgi:LPXTG-site transpeptidase (sortase) family protein